MKKLSARDVKFARAIVDVHNHFGANYKKVFAEHGVRMWHDDIAHPNMTEQDAQHMARTMGEGARTDAQVKARDMSGVGKTTMRKAVYEKMTPVRPLTQLDSYPHKQHVRRELDKKVDKIWEQHKAAHAHIAAGGDYHWITVNGHHVFVKGAG